MEQQVERLGLASISYPDSYCWVVFGRVTLGEWQVVPALRWLRLHIWEPPRHPAAQGSMDYSNM